MATWFFARSDGSNSEPLTAAELKDLAVRGEIGPETPVAKDGVWIRAKQVKGLFDRPVVTAGPRAEGDGYAILDPVGRAAPATPPAAARADQSLPSPAFVRTEDEDDSQPSGPPLAKRATWRPPADRAPGEPWFYGFLDGYAKVVVALGLLQFLAVGALVLLGLASSSGTDVGRPGSAWAGLAAIFALGLPSLGILIGCLFFGGMILLAVDAGRTLRAIRFERTPS